MRRLPHAMLLLPFLLIGSTNVPVFPLKQQGPVRVFEWVPGPLPYPDFPLVSRWEGAFMNVADAPTLIDGFPDNNDSTFRFRIEMDGPVFGNPLVRDEIQVNMQVVSDMPLPDTVVDSIVGIPLTETDVNSLEYELGRFGWITIGGVQVYTILPESMRAFILTSNAVDDDYVPSDNTQFDRTIRIRLAQRLRIVYGAFVLANVQLVPQYYVNINFHILKPCEPYIDSGVSGQGAGDGHFTFIDSDNNGVHGSSESSEPIVGDFDNDDCWDVSDPVCAEQDCISAWERSDIIWTQARIFFVRVGTWDVREAPGGEPAIDTNANGQIDPGEFSDYNMNGMYDGPVDILSDEQVDCGAGEDYTIIDTVGDKQPNTLDIIVANRLALPTGLARGLSYIYFQYPFMPFRRNTSLIASHSTCPGITTEFTLPHEIGHVLRDKDHVDFNRTLLMRDGTSYTDSISATKRLYSAQLDDIWSNNAFLELRN